MNATLSLITKFGKFATIASLCSLVGCASQIRQPISFDEIRTFKVNCSKKEEQLRFLNAVMPTRHEVQMAKLELSVFRDFASDARGKSQLASGTISDFVQDKIDEVERCWDRN